MHDAFDPYAMWLNIPSGPRPPDHYSLLGVERFTTDAQQLHQQALRRMELVRKYQLGPQGTHALRLQLEISRAFDVLGDPQRRAAYDEQLLVESEPDAEVAADPWEDVPDLEEPDEEETMTRPPVVLSEAVVVESPAIAEPSLPPVQMLALSAPTMTWSQWQPPRRRRAQPPVILLRFIPWLCGTAVLVAGLAVAFHLFGKRGQTFQRTIEPPLPDAAAEESPVQNGNPPVASSVLPLADTTWVRDDDPRAFFMFRAEGILRWTNGDSVGGGVWHQTGDQLYFEQHKLREFRGTVFTDRIEGEFIANGQRWKARLLLNPSRD